MTKIISEITWSMKPGYTLTTRVHNKKYGDLNSALSACSNTATCQGVVQEGRKDYYLYRDTKLTERDGFRVWLRGGEVMTFTTMTLSSGGYTWTYMNPYTLEGRVDGKVYSNKDKALAACGANAKCAGVTYDGKGYVLNTGGSPHFSKTATVYIKSGGASSFGGSQWTVLKNRKLTRYLDGSVYTKLVLFFLSYLCN